MRLDDVFGISPEVMATYVERGADETFVSSLQSKKHIVVHGSSKQGKTSLRKKHLPDDKFIAVSCQADWDLNKLFLAILRKAGCRPKISEERSSAGGGKFKIGFTIPVIGIRIGGERKTNKRETATYQMREIDPDDANDVIAGLNEANFSKWIVVEDFHYLPLDTQRKFATYLKAFFENSKIRFIIVAIWTGKNRITTVGDLASRVIAVDVDFWPKHELMQVIENGEKLLNIQFPKSCKDEIIKLSEGSVYIVQEVCQALCQQENVFERQRSPKVVGRLEQVAPLVDEAARQLSPHYFAFLEAFAQGHQATELEMYKWILFAILTTNADELGKGLTCNAIISTITANHPRGRSLNSANIRNALKRVNELQWKRNIQPFVVDYDEAGTTLHIVDRGYYIWRKHQQLPELLAHIELDTQRRVTARR